MKKKKKKRIISQKNKKEIFWNIINALIAALLILLGGLSSGGFSLENLGLAIITGLTIGLLKFRDYWLKEETEYVATRNLFNFTHGL